MPYFDDTECLPYLRALSDDSRWRIVRLLTSLPQGLTLGELAHRVELSDYNASRHVRVLVEVGILDITREGRYKRIQLAPEFRSHIHAQPGSVFLHLGCCRFDFSEGTGSPRPERLWRKTASSRSPASTDQARYIMVGGFLGAGKTTAVAALAQHLALQGRRVGLITNDQGRELVDTQMLRSRGFATEEIAGGCFCCKFNSLVDAASRLSEDARPEVVIAEPVGSCTDLMATVTYPLRRIHGDRFTIAPVSVLVDPLRARRVLGLEPGRTFSEKVLYIYRKQLEEADLIVISKSDLIDVPSEAELRATLERQFPQARVLAISAREGGGMEDWFALILSGNQIPRPSMPVDYDTYAGGEALLGWLNATIDVGVEEEIDASPLLQDLALELQRRLRAADAEIAHLKMTLSPDNALAGEVAVINLVRNDGKPEMGQELEEPITGGQIILNLRAECDPERLAVLVRASVAALSQEGCLLTLEHLERFRPSRPQPTHRD